MDENFYKYYPSRESAKSKARRKNAGLRPEPVFGFKIESFQCSHCRVHVPTASMISGVQNRNHCPFCLWSRHLDLIKPGDRLAACRAAMQPVGLTLKRSTQKYDNGRGGELMIIHRCTECDRLSINRLAADDDSQAILELFAASQGLDFAVRRLIHAAGIDMLGAKDARFVRAQLYGSAGASLN